MRGLNEGREISIFADEDEAKARTFKRSGLAKWQTTPRGRPRPNIAIPLREPFRSSRIGARG